MTGFDHLLSGGMEAECEKIDCFFDGVIPISRTLPTTFVTVTETAIHRPMPSKDRETGFEAQLMADTALAFAGIQDPENKREKGKTDAAKLWRWFWVLWTQCPLMICFKAVQEAFVTDSLSSDAWNGLPDCRDREETDRIANAGATKRPFRFAWKCGEAFRGV